MLNVTIDPCSSVDTRDDLSPLLDEAVAGDDAALERLVCRFRSQVRSWAARFTRDQDDADDVAQDVMLGLRARVRAFDGRRPFTAWLYVITRNMALSARRRASRREELASRFVEASANQPAVDAETDAEVMALNDLVLRHFRSLPTKQRLIFEMSDLRGMTPASIAQELGMPPSTVRVHLFRARAAIRRRLLDNHEALVREYRS